MKELIKKHKGRLISAAAWAVSLLIFLIIFYIFKDHNEYYISLKTKAIVVGCGLISTLLILFKPQIKLWISYILEAILIIGASVFLFRYLEPLVNDMSIFIPEARNLNILIVFAVIAFFYGVFQNAGAGVGVGGFVVYAFYLIEYFTVRFRGTPLILSDFLTAKTAVGVMDNYNYILDERMIVAFYILALMTAAGIFVSGKKEKVLTHILTAAAAILISVVIFVLLIFTELFTKDSYKTVAFVPIESAQQNGLPLNIIISLKESFLKAPEGYSNSEVSRIIEENFDTEDVQDTSDIEKPNIIVIMNESLTYLDYLGEVEMTEDPLAKLKAMDENCVKGTLISSIYGGNTPNSEFEFLTGCSLAFLPQGIVTYQQLIDSELPTFATHLKDMGYTASAIHLYNPEYFSRSRIYPLLGFDEFENLSNTDIDVTFAGDYTTDASSFEAIERKYEEKKGKPFFAFCVTVQNHGGYWHQQTDVRLTNIVSDHADDYASLLKKTDDAFADLIEYFENVEEPTIIVMFGDHQPNIGGEFYEQIWQNSSYTDEELTYLKAKVPFIIWANYDIEEKQMGEMSINYLGPTVMETAGLPLSGYQTFVGGLREKVPVVSGIGFVDDSGRHFKDVSSSDYYSNLREYEFLQYNYLKGNSKDPFYE